MHSSSPLARLLWAFYLNRIYTPPAAGFKNWLSLKSTISANLPIFTWYLTNYSDVVSAASHTQWNSLRRDRYFTLNLADRITGARCRWSRAVPVLSVERGRMMPHLPRRRDLFPRGVLEGRSSASSVDSTIWVLSSLGSVTGALVTWFQQLECSNWSSAKSQHIYTRDSVYGCVWYN